MVFHVFRSLILFSKYCFQYFSSFFVKSLVGVFIDKLISLCPFQAGYLALQNFWYNSLSDMFLRLSLLVQGLFYNLTSSPLILSVVLLCFEGCKLIVKVFLEIQIPSAWG